ncbi:MULTISPECIES: (2Fe-2S) ferredoxin domain-containing protein [Cyanophyceae]|uniref:(2Fe-2S) ferredoxin domain-containing protein n=1 Tax=Cyanophyceae TaxID=3028117 RepID=UPI001685E756|nr:MULTISPECIES: (2Fe-2S) ferredoxin domain-containing protein [Cyanophyceae]MBD1916726.1 NAD(P)H-dependent oxidoreductase subunit E [Phormidium sp. FACHB-77]MBD2029356.1 NAD(P)H-dependent oxidoreductase subunit E [Phormidium sp. FACHB-322]MBD2051931.1 NAD(P)H-dependent oxidoreductase subunit E [Leptolyngbya sp. FACHB-60]
MTLHESATLEAGTAMPTGQVLKGQYSGAYRSDKGKIKGLLLQAGEAKFTVKLPKYLRPMLVRELAPGDFVQVWAYPEDDRWRAINVLPLPQCEAEMLRQQWGDLVPASKPAQTSQKRMCIEVCTKGKCYKQGARQVHSALQEAVDSDPALAHVAIKETGCMKACKQGPNLRMPNGRMLHRVSPAEALAQLDAKR